MMGIGEIRAASNRAARKAKRNRTVPVVPNEAQRKILVQGYLTESQLKIPFLGGYVPKGWVKTDDAEFFVDTSGFGDSGEPALSHRQFARALANLPEGYGVAGVEFGQFQGYVAVYKPVAS